MQKEQDVKIRIRGGSKRRPAMNVSSKEIKDWHEKKNSNTKFQKVNINKENPSNVEFFAKLQQSAINSHPESTDKPLNYFKSEKKFQKILRNIEPRGGSFYRFGFKSFEKTNKKLFADVFNVAASKMKGTMHVGEMWSIKQTTNYLKENKIFMDKMKLIDKLKEAMKQQQKDMMQSSTTLYLPPVSTGSGKSIHSRPYMPRYSYLSRFSKTDVSNDSFRELNRSIEEIHRKLQNLKPFNSTQKNIEKLKKMEDCVEKINEIDVNYHEKIGEWV